MMLRWIGISSPLRMPPTLSVNRLLAATLAATTALCPIALDGQSLAARLYNEEDGLDNRSIVALAQQQDRQLWIATENGLFRYDGAHFRKFGRSDGFTEPRFFNLSIDRKGTLWAATPSGLFFFDGSRFNEVRANASSVLLTINSRIASAPNGELIVSDTRGRILSLLQDPTSHAWVVHRFAEIHPSFPWTKSVDGIFLDRSGTLWFGCGAAICFFREDGKAPGKSAGGSLADLPPDGYDSFFQDRSGRLWARGARHLVTWLPSQTQVDDLSATAPPESFKTFCRRITQDSFGNILMTTGRGFATWDGHTWRESNQTTQGAIQGATDLLADREGNLWIGTAGTGLLEVLGYNLWQNFSTADGLPGPQTYAIARDALNRIWIGGDSGVSLMLPGSNRIVDSPLSKDKDANWIENLAPVPGGGMWIANISGQVWHVDTKDRVDFRGTIHGEIQRLRIDSHGVVWVATSNGIYTLDCPAGAACRGTASSDPVLRSDFFADLIFDPDGTAWMVGNRGLYRVRNGMAVRLDVTGISNGFSLIAPGAGNTLWLAGHIPGVVRVRVEGDAAHIVEVHTAPELASDYVEFLEDDHQGRLWIGTDQGVNVIAGNSVTRFDNQDGLIWNDTDWKAFLADFDHSVWIGTSGGLSHLLQPDAVLTHGPFSALIDETVYSGIPLKDGGATLWRNSIFTTRFAGLTFRDNRKLLYRYQLEGFDPSTVSTYIPFVRFQQLPPGRYTLRVTAEDEGHHTVSSVATFSFTLTPPWWRTRLFQALLGLATLAIVALIWRWSHLALLSQRERLQRLVAERTRELEQLAVTDSLTGLPNRGAILAALSREIALSRSRKTPICVAIVDLDHFKRINDTLGHLAGDHVLRLAASRLAASVRASDIVGRYGGEEFLVIFRDAQKEFGRERCEAIRQAVCESAIRFENQDLSLTASIGAAWTRGEIELDDELIALADRALYLAKASGRNCVQLATSEAEWVPAN